MKVHIKIVIGIALGGVVGTCLRYFLNVSMLTFHYPVSTLIENILGSFLLGGLTGYVVHEKMAEWLRLSLTVGVLGSFSTMSTLASDAVFMAIHKDSMLQAVGYVAGSFIGGLMFAFLGYVLGQRIGKRKVQKRTGALQ